MQKDSNNFLFFFFYSFWYFFCIFSNQRWFLLDAFEIILGTWFDQCKYMHTYNIYLYIYIVYVYVYVSLIVLALYIVRLNMIIRYIFCLCLIVVGFVWWCLVLFCLVAVKNLTLLSLSFFLFSCFFSASTSILPQLLFFLGLTDKCCCSIARSFYSICKWN